MKLKVCGMKYNTAEVAKLQPDYLGFIFYKKSPRDFEDIIPQLPKEIKKVGVFVDENVEVIVDKIEKYKLDAIQLHGDETVNFIQGLRTVCHSALDAESTTENEILNHTSTKLSTGVQHDKRIKIIKVFSIKDDFNFSILKDYETVCDYFLFDTKGKLPGGNGYTFNWKVLKNYPSTKPYFLSGGIGLDEVENILSFMRRQESQYCYAIDINSKFEIEPGLKNIEKLREFKKHLSFRT